MVGLGQGLECSLKDGFWLSEVSTQSAHVEEEFDVTGPDFETFVIFLAQLLVDVLHKVVLVAAPINVDQLEVHFPAVVDIEGPLDDVLQLLSRAELALEVHKGDPQVQLFVLGCHRHLLDGAFSNSPG